jgi:uncharacterized membrane protein
MNHCLTGLFAFLLVFLAGCASQPRVSFQKDVYPILEDNCLACHTPPRGKGYLKTHLNMQSYETLMRGTVYGQVVLPGDSRHSILNMLVEGRAEASMRMPHERDEPLTPEEIEVLRLWVEQGAQNN